MLIFILYFSGPTMMSLKDKGVLESIDKWDSNV